MIKLILSEWTKFRGNNKNKIIIALMIAYLLGLVIYNGNLHDSYMYDKERDMGDQAREATGRLQVLDMLEEMGLEGVDPEEPGSVEIELDELESIEVDSEELSPAGIDFEEVEFLITEASTSTQLGTYYRSPGMMSWQRALEIENEKYHNLIFGAENNYMSEDILRYRNQLPEQLRENIAINEHLIKNNIEPQHSPYQINGFQFLLFILRGYTPLILLALIAILTVDIYLGEIEEGSYKTYFTQPFSRAKIYWSKLISIMMFTTAILGVIILTFFIVITAIYGIGDLDYPQAIATSEMLTSLSSNGENLGQYQIVSTGRYLALGYLLFVAMLVMTIASTKAVSIFINSISSTLGLVTGVFMLNFVFDSTLSNASIFRFIQPLAYSNIDLVIRGQVNASYVVGILLALTLTIVMIILSATKLIKSDLLGSEG
ncbi:ABC transporter permease [Proteinivorax hydrogeniformans]|uniref:ABC transporter permease n=1 Tax=Proteinivorax hydrogeniformans TaxID=1826727 RepID=A0AAU8HXC6_9FIRM